MKGIQGEPNADYAGTLKSSHKKKYKYDSYKIFSVSSDGAKVRSSWIRNQFANASNCFRQLSNLLFVLKHHRTAGEIV